MKNEVLEDLLLLDIKANKNNHKKQNEAYLPFHLYVLDGNVRKIKQYITAGYDINIKDKWGRTAVHYAVYNADIKILKLLIQAGGDYTFKDTNYDGCSLLHLSAAEGYLDKVQYLVEELHLNIYERDKNGFGVIFYSMLFDNLEVAEYFVAKGAKCEPDIDEIEELCVYLIKILNKINNEEKLAAINKVIDYDAWIKKNNIIKFLNSCH